tara:strand:- start:4593 stop:5033 length:441 start_codon:yes stop_codon:yes gene_type:complete
MTNKIIFEYVKLSHDEIRQLKKLLQILKPQRRTSKHWRTANLTKDPITINEPRITVNPISFQSLHSLAFAVCVKHGISLSELLDHRGKQYLVLARIDFCHLAYKHVIKNKNSITRFLNRSHSSAISHLLKKEPSPIFNHIQEILYE